MLTATEAAIALKRNVDAWYANTIDEDTFARVQTALMVEIEARGPEYKLEVLAVLRSTRGRDVVPVTAPAVGR